MPKRTLVTFGTDGFRDYVTLPDGRTFNLGSVSVLAFVAELAMNGPIARRALDTFLKKNSATLAVDLEKLQVLLKPRRSRWAGLGNDLIPEISRTSLTGNLMDQTTEMFESRLASVEANLQLLDQQPGDTKVVADIQTAVRELVACGCQGFLGGPPPIFTETQAPSPEMELEALADTPVKLAAAVDPDLKKEIEFFLDNDNGLLNKKKAVLTSLLGKVKSGKYDHNQAKKAWESFVEDGIKSYVREFKEDPKSFSKQLKDVLAKEIADSEKAAIENGEYDHLKTASSEPQDVSSNTPLPQPPLGGGTATEKKDMDPLAFKVKKADETPAGVQKAEDVAKGKVSDPYKGKDQSKNDTYYKLANDPALAFKVSAPKVKKADETPAGVQKAEDVAKGKVDDPYKGKDLSNNDTYYKLAADEVQIVNEALASNLLTKVEQGLPTVEASTKKFASVAKEDLFRISAELTELLKTANMADPKVRLALVDLSKKTDHVLNYFV